MKNAVRYLKLDFKNIKTYTYEFIEKSNIIDFLIQSTYKTDNLKIYLNK